MLTTIFQPRRSSEHFRATWQDTPAQQGAARLGAVLQDWLPEQGHTVTAFADAVGGAALDTHEAWYREQPWYCRVWWALQGCTDGDA